MNEWIEVYLDMQKNIQSLERREMKVTKVKSKMTKQKKKNNISGI